MHTIDTMSEKDFDIEIYGDRAEFDHVLTNFHVSDRIGVVVRQPGGSMGASGFLMAAVTRFYRFYRNQLQKQSNKLRIYPEFFVFHVGKRHMNHYWMDIWPPHKEVIVEDDPEQILEAINDRGITRLLVEEMEPSKATFLRETICSAEQRIVSAYVYSPSGRVDNADVKIMSCITSESYVLESLHMTKELSEKEKAELQQKRLLLHVNGRVVETYRQIEVRDALQMLTHTSKPSERTLKYIEQLVKEQT